MIWGAIFVTTTLLVILPCCCEALGENFGGRRSRRVLPEEQSQPLPPLSSQARSTSFGVADLPALGEGDEDSSLSNPWNPHAINPSMYRQHFQPQSYALPPEEGSAQQLYQGSYLPPSGYQSGSYDAYGHGPTEFTFSDSYTSSYPASNEPYILPPGFQQPPSRTYEGAVAATTAGMDSMFLAGSSSMVQPDLRVTRRGRRGGATGGGSGRSRRRSREAGVEAAGEDSSRLVASSVGEASGRGEGSSSGTSTVRTRRRGRAASSVILLPPINTGRERNEAGDDSDDEENNEAIRHPQTARVHQTRMEAIAETLGMPSTARLVLSAQQQKLRLRRWMTQEWERQGLHVEMAAQDLALAVARTKIAYPGIAMSIGKMCWDRVQKGKGWDPWYLYDYHTWSDTYQHRITHLEGVYEQEGISDEAEIRQLLLDNFWNTTPKHYAALADAEAEAAEVDIAREVGEEFLHKQLESHMVPGQPASIAMVAEHSWNWHAKGYTHPLSMKYLFKYLRCVNEWGPEQLDQLKSLQDAEQAKVAPAARRPGRGRGRARRDPGGSS